MTDCGEALRLGEVFDETDDALVGGGAFEAVCQFALRSVGVEVFHAAYGANVDSNVFAGGIGDHVRAINAFYEVRSVGGYIEGGDVGDTQLYSICFEAVEDVLCGDVCAGGDCVVCGDVQD